MVLTGTRRKWNPRPACGTAVKSAGISISARVPLEVTGIRSDCVFFSFIGAVASLLPTKTLAIGGETRPDQPGVPAVLLETLHHGPCF